MLLTQPELCLDVSESVGVVSPVALKIDTAVLAPLKNLQTFKRLLSNEECISYQPNVAYVYENAKLQLDEEGADLQSIYFIVNIICEP